MGRMLRLAMLACLTLAGGCVFAASEQGADLGPDDDVRGSDACFDDTDCLLAGPSCCECPSFAVGLAGGWGDACEQVDCPLPPSCPALVARCQGGVCAAACAPATCDLSCPTGFAVDAAGCTTCACAGGGAQPACELDADCVRTPADCCGCARGGADTAVPADTLGGFVDGLGCTGNESCPGVSTCEAGDEPRCVGGQCMLVGGGDPSPPSDECGRPELPPCPSGTVCVINADGAEVGTGRCAPP